jgi:hypothetical protein
LIELHANSGQNPLRAWPQAAESEASALHAATLLACVPTPRGALAPLSFSTPPARQLAAVRLSLAQLELRLASEAASHADGDRAARRPPLPKVPASAGLPPSAVLAYLDTGAESAPASGGANGLAWEDWALLHAGSAAAAAGSGPAGARVRAAALLAEGQALRVKAGAAGAGAGEGQSSQECQTAGPPSGAPATARWRLQSLESLQAALEAAMAAGDLRVARAAALALARWQRELGSQAEAAEWLAVAQSAAASDMMRSAFLTAAALASEGGGEGGCANLEVLAWRRQAAAACGGGLGAGAEALAQQVGWLGSVRVRSGVGGHGGGLGGGGSSNRLRITNLLSPPVLLPLRRPPPASQQGASPMRACNWAPSPCSRRPLLRCQRARPCCCSTTMSRRGSCSWS